MVTVEPVKEVVGAGESVQFRFRRTGSITGALTISFQGFEHSSSGDATLADASVTFLADNDTVVYTNDVTSSGTVNPISRAHTVLIYGDAGRGGLHRSWIAGDPNRATVVVAVAALGPMPVTASYPSRVAAAESVSVEYTVTNLGTRPLPGYGNRESDGTKISTFPDRGNCDIRDEIPAGDSRTCSASFTATNQDVTNGKIVFNATARNGTCSSTLSVYIRVAQPVEFGFTPADTLEVTEGPNVTATLPVTRTGRLNEAVTVAYRLRSHENKPATPGEDFTDPSNTPGLLTFPANVTSANIVINITQDQIDEERERFKVVLVPLADGTITEGKESRVVLIKDEHQENDPYRPTASLQLVSSGPVPENEGPVEFAIVLDRVWGREGRYEVEVLPDQLTATPGLVLIGKKGDFEYPGIVIARIPAGQTRFEFSVPLYDDDVREEDETFQLQLSSSYDDSYRTIGTSNRALATIADDDRVPPTEVVLSLSHNGSALESVPEGSTPQDITVTASFPQIRWPGDASNAPLRPADPRDVDTTVRVQFDPNSGATHAAGLDDFAPLKVEDDQGAFQEVESFDIVIPARQTIGTATLRFKPVNDDVDEEDETVTLLGSELVAGNPEGSLPVRSASFTIIDDDTRGITVSPSSALMGLSLVEGGEPGTYSLVLDSQPTDTVVITLAGNQGGFLRLVPDTLTFTTSNWATPQTVSVMALDDGIGGGVGTQDMVTHQVSGGDYGSVTAPDISVNIEDTTKAFVYLEGGQASESDGYVEFTVTVRPILRTTPVLVRYATVDGTAIAGSDYTREVETGQTYKILNIPAGQSSGTIRIPIIDDQVYESADETFTLQLTNHNDKATLDGGATSLTATGAIADDDPTPVVSVAGPAGEVSYVSENAKDPVTFTLTLMGQSAGDVTVDYATGEAGLLGLLTARQGPAGATQDEDYAATSGTVTFTSGQTTKTVTVQVTNDDVSEETEFFGFKISAPQGADLRGQRSEDVADVGLVDDDARGVTIDPTSISLDEPASAETAVAGAYTVNLNSRPTDTVTVTIGGGDPAVSLSGDTLTNNQLTFTTINWNTAQTITVTPVKDDNAVGETITLTSGGDYAGIAADSVTINLTDSDARNMVLSKQSLTVTEGDATGVRYTVRLATEPTGSVTVTISGHDGADLTLTNNQLTFTTTNWDTAQTVTVKAGEDDDAANDTATLTHTASGGDYANITADLPVTVTDDDEPAVVLSETGLTVTEGDGAGSSYTVKLATEPTGSVSVSITGHAGTDLTLDKTTLTFTVDNWDDAQTVTVEGGHDGDGAADTATLTHSASGGDYASVSNTLPVTVTDDDEPAVVLSETGLTVTEGDAAGSSYTVKLATEPTSEVTVTVSGHAGTDLTLDKTTLTFTADNWNTAQTVTVKAGEDGDGAADTATLTHSASGGDYANITADLPVTVTDDDTAVTVQFGADAYTVSEGSTATITVILNADPERTVVIPLVATGQVGATTDDYSGVPEDLTINAGETSKTFEFMATADDTSDTGESVKISFGASLPSRVTEGTPNEATVTIKQVSTQFDLDCAGTAVVWCADVGFSDQTAENWGWAYLRYGEGLDPEASLSDDDFQFRAVDYTVLSMELRPGTHPVMPNGWSRWQQGYSSFRIVINWGPSSLWDPSEEHYRDWVLHVDGLELPFKDAFVFGDDFTWVGAEFQQIFNDWIPSTVTKIGIKEVAAADQGTNPLLPWAPMQVDASPEGPNRLRINWAKPAWYTPGLPDPTKYIVQWKLASASWSDSATVSQREVVSSSNFPSLNIDGLTADALYSVRVIAGNDAGDGPPSEETLGRPQDVVTWLLAKTVNGRTLTLRFSEQLDRNAVPAATAFVVMADGGLIAVDSVAISGEEVTLTLNRAVTAANSVLVRYDKSTDPSAVFLRDTGGNHVQIPRHFELLRTVNVTPQSSVQPLTAQFTNMPVSHDGATRFTFDIEFSEPVWIGDGLAREDMLEITGGTVISAPWKDRRTDKVTVHVRPDTRGDIVIVLPGNRVCAGIIGSGDPPDDPVAGAPCAIGNRVLTNEPTATIPGPLSSGHQVVENTPAEGEPRINGIPELGQTLSADTTAIADADGLENAVFQYQWLAEDAGIPGATGSTYTLTSGDVGKAIRVRVSFTDDGGNEETLTSEPAVVTAAGLQLQSATVDGGILTLTYNEELDTGVTLGTTAFAVNVNGSARALIAVGVGESNVLLLLSSAVEAGDTVTVDYTVPEGPDFIRDIRGRKAASFSGQAVTNDTAADQEDTARDADTVPEHAAVVVKPPLTATIHDAPASHNGQDAFTFELRFSEDPKPDFSYTTVRDHAFTVTGGSVTYVRRLEPGKNVRWEITVTPGSSADVAIVLKATTDCEADGAICTEEGGKLSGGLQLVVPGPNAPATGLPTITGAAQVGETLTADTTGIADADGLDNAAFAYQWLADDAEINGATASTYTLVAADAGKAIRVRVSFTDDSGNDEQFTSAATSAVAAAPPPSNTPATGAPTITGTAEVGETLTADTTGIADDDGLDNAAFAYQWLADDAEINGANASTYILVATDVGKAVKVRVSFTDDAGNDEELTSAVTGAVAAAPPPPNTPATGLPTITGTAEVGETLTADTTGIADADGLGNAAFAYQWLAAADEINGATASTYTLAAADAGKAIRVRVSFTDDSGNDEQFTSAATSAVAAAPPPSNTPATGAPTITGTAEVGETLTADTTGIADDDGLDNAAFAYQWLADDAEINGANASTYILVATDVGKAVKVRVSFTDDAGNDEELTSAVTGAVAAAPPPPNTPATGLPTITGTVEVGETLTADTTGIADADGLGNAAFAYQWLAAADEINGATAATYSLADDDAGKAITVRVSFTDDAGNDEQLTSAATGEVAAAVVKPPLTATVHDVPSSHNGQGAFTFDLRFSEDPKPDFSYTTVRDHAFTVTVGSVTYVRRLEPGKNIRWEITVTPGSSADVAIVLNVTTDCEAAGAICTEDGRSCPTSWRSPSPGPAGRTALENTGPFFGQQ